MDIQAIIAAVDEEIQRLQGARAILAQVTDGAGAKAQPAAQPRRRRRLSKAARARIAAAQHKRWAAQKAGAISQGKRAVEAAPPARKTATRRLSPEARKRIAAAQKKRWAATKAAPSANKAAAKPSAAPAKSAAKSATKAAAKQTPAQSA